MPPRLSSPSLKSCTIIRFGVTCVHYQLAWTSHHCIRKDEITTKSCLARGGSLPTCYCIWGVLMLDELSDRG